MFIMLNYILLKDSFIPYAHALTEVHSKTEYLEQALIQQLHPVIYPSLQKLYNEDYPQFDQIEVVHISSYITGNNTQESDNRLPVSATGGAKVFEIIVQLRALNHSEFVQIYMNNETDGSTYKVTSIKAIKY